MPSYLSYRRSLTTFDEDDKLSWITVNGNHIPVKKGQTKKEAIEEFIKSKGDKNEPASLGNALNQALSDIKAGNTTSSGISSRQIALGASKIHLPEKEAAECAEQIIEYTRNADKGDRTLIDKAIWNSDPYNEKTFSGVEGKWNRDFKVGDKINGRLISWSKNPLVAIQFESIDDTRKILVIDENPGMDISDFSQESDEEEVLTATNMNFVVKEIKQWEGFDLINLEYKGKKQ